MSQVFSDDDRMSSLVADELQELRIHQEELRQAKAAMARSNEAGIAAASQQSAGASPQQAHIDSDLEAKVAKLSSEVLSELKALTDHQEELRSTKTTVRQLSERAESHELMITSCRKAVSDVKGDLEKLQCSKAEGSKSPGATLHGDSSEATRKEQVKLTPLITGSSSTPAAKTLAKPAPVPVEDAPSEVSESYDNEAFDEADEDSMSAS